MLRPLGARTCEGTSVSVPQAKQKARVRDPRQCSVLGAAKYEATSPRKASLSHGLLQVTVYWGGLDGGFCVLPLELEPVPELLVPLMLDSDSFLFFLCFLAFFPECSVEL